jgi:WD40 repeat protein/tRNA A-37 threonylcarbamoyl transferase component Bud32
MTANRTDFSESEQRLGEIVFACLEALERGESLNQEELLARHPEFATELQEFFAGRNEVHQLATPLREVAEAASAGAGLSDPAGCKRQGSPPATHVPTFGDYDLLERIGQGGMGVVYRACQKSLHRLVALKMIRGGQFASAADLLRLRNEAEAAAHLDHPNIVPIYEVGVSEGQPYFSMKLIEGGSLSQVLANGEWQTSNGESERRAAQLLLMVARAVHHAHQRGVLHRDLKPSNILLDATGTPYVSDFGLAKRLEIESSLSHTGDIVGTPSYLAPELAAGRKKAVTTGADVYGLGAILYALLTGRPPFRGDTPLETLVQVRECEPEAPSGLNRQVNRDLETICLKCLEKDPQRRYGSAEALAEELERWLAGKPIRARPISRIARIGRWCRRNPAIAALTAAVLLVVVLGVVGLAVTSVMILQEKKRTDVALADAESNLELARDAAERERRGGIEAKQHQQIAEELLARSQLERGVKLLEGGDSLGLLDLLQARVTSENIPQTRDSLPPLWAGWKAAGAGQLVHVVGHNGPVVAVAFSPSGEKFATASNDCTARLWTTANGLPAGQPLCHPAAVLAISFSPDGKLLATGSRDGSARLWDTATGEPHGAPLWSGQDPVNVVAFSADGKLLLVASAGVGPDGQRLTTALGGTAQLWDPTTGKRHNQSLEHRMALSAAAFSPNGKLVGTASENTVQLWDPITGRPRGPALRDQHTVALLAFSPDGEFLAAATADGSAQLWKTVDGLRHGPVMLFRRWALDLKFSPDGKFLATALKGWNAQLWETANGTPYGQPLRHEGPVRTLAFSPDGNLLATGSLDGTARVWDPATGELFCAPLRHQGVVYAVAFSPDGKLLASASEDGTARLWATVNKARSRPMQHNRLINAIAFSPDGRQLATGPDGGDARLWEVETGQPLGPPLHHQDDVTAVVFSPNGRLLATGSDDGAVLLWDPSTGQPRGRLSRQKHGVRALAFTPDGTLLACGLANGVVQFLEPNTGKPHGKPFPKQERLTGLAFSPDGKLMVTGAGSAAQLWDVATREPCGKFLRRGGEVRGVQFSPDGKRWVVASEDGIAQLWDIATGQPCGPPLRHQGEVWSAGFSPDGNLLATGLSDNTVRVWDVGRGSAIYSFPLRHGRPGKGPVRAVAFSPDGKLLASASVDGSARLWRLPQAPADLRAMQLGTWVALGARQSESGDVEVIPWQEWRELREKLQILEVKRQTAAGQRRKRLE